MAGLHPARSARSPPHFPKRAGTGFRSPHDARSASFTRVHLQLGKAIVGAAEPSTKLAVDILQHDHIPVHVGLVALVKLLSRELVQHGWALRDDRGRSVLHFDESHLAEKNTGPETRHANCAPRFPALAHYELAGVNDEHRAPRFSFRYDGCTGVEAALDQHRDQEIDARIREATEKRCGEQELFQIGRAGSHRGNILSLPVAASRQGAACSLPEQVQPKATANAARSVAVSSEVLETRPISYLEASLQGACRSFDGRFFTGSSSDQSPSGSTCPFGNGGRNFSPSDRSTRSSR